MALDLKDKGISIAKMRTQTWTP